MVIATLIAIPAMAPGEIRLWRTPDEGSADGVGDAVAMMGPLVASLPLPRSVSLRRFHSCQEKTPRQDTT